MICNNAFAKVIYGAGCTNYRIVQRLVNDLPDLDTKDIDLIIICSY